MATTEAAARLSPASDGYQPLDDDCLDEAFAPGGAVRRPYEAVMDALARHDLARLRERVQSQCEERGVTFGDGEALTVDPVPRLVGGEEWRAIERGIGQRMRALNAFLADVYGEQRIFERGAVPRHLLTSAPGYEPRMRGLLDPELPAAALSGLDLVHDAAGRWLVLEDNLRMPSGAAYALALREIVPAALGADLEPLPIDGYVAALGAALRAAAPEGGGEPQIAILSDGKGSGAWFEHRALGLALGVPVLTPAQLESAGGTVYARDGRERRRLDLLYRRLDDDRLSDDCGQLTDLGELLLPGLESGRLRCVNAFGSAVADDKLTHAYVERMIGFYLDEEPLLRSVPSFDLCEEDVRREPMQRLDELTLKPRDRFGGSGVTIMPRASGAQRQRAIEQLRRHPEAFVVQETISLSSHPTVCGRRLRPRRVDLRPFAVAGGGRVATMPGGLTRYATAADASIVNSSSGGGCKDTWVVTE